MPQKLPGFFVSIDMACTMGTMLLGVTEAAARMRKKVRWLYRHLDEYETVYEDVPTVRIVFDDKTKKAVKKNG